MVEIKRGYAKWRDENGKKHKVPLSEYNAMLELEDEEPIEEAPPREIVNVDSTEESSDDSVSDPVRH